MYAASILGYSAASPSAILYQRKEKHQANDLLLTWNWAEKENKYRREALARENGNEANAWACQALIHQGVVWILQKCLSIEKSKWNRVYMKVSVMQGYVEKRMNKY